MKTFAGLLALTLAASCAPAPPPPTRPIVVAPPAPPPPPSRYATPTPYVTPRPSAQPPAPPAAADACGAGAHLYLIGKNRSEIPVPVNPAQRRVHCSTCPVTMDYSPRRLNIVYDSQTNLITEVKCG